MSDRIGAGVIFYQKKGTKIRLGDRMIVLTSDCQPEKLSYTYKEVESGKTDYLSCFTTFYFFICI